MFRDPAQKLRLYRDGYHLAACEAALERSGAGVAGPSPSAAHSSQTRQQTSARGGAHTKPAASKRKRKVFDVEEVDPEEVRWIMQQA